MFTVSNYSSSHLAIISDQYQMLKTVKSAKNFNRIKEKSFLFQQVQHQVQPLTRGELFLESKIQEQNSLEICQKNENSQLEGQVVKSSIDSNKTKKSSLKSVPLSELIFRDTGYDHLFFGKIQSEKLEHKYYQNLKQLKQQTEQIRNLLNMQFISQESRQITKKIQLLQKDINQIRSKRKNKLFENYPLEFACTGERKKKERLSGRIILGSSKQNRSNMLTECDSKTTSLSTAPITPICQQKLMISPEKKYFYEYMLILKTKRDAIKGSIAATKRYYTEIIEKSKQENMAYRQQISLIDFQNICQTPIKKTKFLTNCYFDNSYSARNSSRRLFKACSPKSIRANKIPLSKLRSSFGIRLRSNPQEEYFLSGRLN